MRSFLWQDLKRSFLNTGFALGFLAVAMILVSAVVTQAPLDRSRSSYFIMANIYASSGFGPFAAVFPSLAYASVFCEEAGSGYLQMIFARMSARRFGLTRILTVALSGGVMIAAPIAITLGMAYYFGIPGIPEGSDEGLMAGSMIWDYVLKYGDWSVYVVKVTLGFLFGCLWALVGLAFAVWIPNKYVSLIAPFVLYEAIWLGLDVEVLNPIFLLRGEEAGSYVLACFVQCIYILAVILVIMQGLKRRFR